MSKVKIKLNSAGVKEILKGEAIQSVLQDKAAEIALRCGEGYDYDIHVGKNRANSIVSANSFEAKRDNSNNNTILKAVR